MNIENSNILNILHEKYGIIGESKPMLEALQRLIQAAPTDLAVLITGETGTGKELFAHAIHGLSNRKKFPFISVNCGAIPETLLESELFGYEKGAFTGAVDQRKGFFESANNGTIFLDEIGEMPVGTQVKLLRILESGEFSRLGSSEQRRVNVRLVAATNRNLDKEVRDGNFRQDLFYRLKSVQIMLPSIRERPEDISTLVEYFATKACDKINLRFRGISQEALEILEHHQFPGNIRELKNLIDTVIILEQIEFITPAQLRLYITPALPPHNNPDNDPQTTLVPYTDYNIPHKFELEIIFRTLLELKNDMFDIKRTLGRLSFRFEEMQTYSIDNSGSQIQDITNNNIDYTDDLNLADTEKRLIKTALKKFDGNRRLAASALGISERTLYRKLNDYDIEV